MSTTTQILFNSPALHSLRRDQLVKLCKIHSLKPSGKKTELIERLQLHAKSLPLDDPLSVATRSEIPDARLTVDSEDEGSDCSGEGSSSVACTITRPSEQWEVVMDAIEEVDEDTKGSLRSNRGVSNTAAGEFGTNTSKGSVTSSLRAIANSLGLKRNASKVDASSPTSSSLSSKEAGQSSSTLPTSDPNVEPEEPSAPIPGQTNLEGLPAPSNARLSFSQAQATTTIRLVSTAPTNAELLLSPPKLKPFATTFDLVPPTPGGADTSSVPVWPLSPGGAARESLYPAVPTFQAFGDLLTHPSLQTAQADASDMDIDVDMPGGLSLPSIHQPTPKKSNNGARFNTGATPRSTEKPSAEPIDIFSPAPKPQRASSRSRAAISRSEPFMFGSQQPQDNTSNLQFRLAAQSVLDEMNKRLAEDGVEGVDVNVLNNRPTTTEETTAEPKGPVRAGNMFDKVHQKAFDKMDSIATHYAAKRGAQSTAAQPILSKKRKSSLVVKERKPGASAARHRPSHNRVASGASVKSALSGGFGGEEDDDVADRRLSKRPRVEREGSDAPVQPERISLDPAPPDPEEEAKKQKEREAIRRRLEHNKAKRRSSMGRPSLGRAPSPKHKPSRFGFLSSAKTLVQNVWNRGAGSKAPATKAPLEPKVPLKAPEVKKVAAVPGCSGAPPIGSQTRRIPSGGSSSRLPVASGRSTLAPPGTSSAGGSTSAYSRTSRAPIPSFDPPSSSTPANLKSSTVGRNQSKSSSTVGFSSLGAKPSFPAGSGQVSSLGGKPTNRNLATSTQKSIGTIPRSRTMSTLMAPTASSLAKANRLPGSAASHSENSNLAKAGSSSKSQMLATSPQSSAALEQITNSPRSPADAARPTKIFSQPLSPPAARAPMSLTGTATSIVGKAADEKTASSSKPVLPPKPKVLPGRRPRISRSKVIARLASQREAGPGATPGARREKARGKIRSSVGAGVAGKTRQSYAGARGGDVLISAKKRVRQSEYARRRSRAVAGEGAMDLALD